MCDTHTDSAHPEEQPSYWKSLLGHTLCLSCDRICIFLLPDCVCSVHVCMCVHIFSLVWTHKCGYACTHVHAHGSPIPTLLWGKPPFAFRGCNDRRTTTPIQHFFRFLAIRTAALMLTRPALNCRAISPAHMCVSWLAQWRALRSRLRLAVIMMSPWLYTPLQRVTDNCDLFHWQSRSVPLIWPWLVTHVRSRKKRSIVVRNWWN